MAATVIQKSMPLLIGWGTATLASGTVTIADTRVTATCKISVVYDVGQVLANSGALNASTVTAGTSFVVSSSTGSDANNIVYYIYAF